MEKPFKVKLDIKRKKNDADVQILTAKNRKFQGQKRGELRQITFMKLVKIENVYLSKKQQVFNNLNNLIVHFYHFEIDLK